MEFRIEELDPEWTVYAKCPRIGCKQTTYACCQEHLIEAATAHYLEKH